MLCVFGYVFIMFAASPSPIMDSTTVGRRPKAASIMGDGEAANKVKTSANTYTCVRMCASCLFDDVTLIGPLEPFN